MSGRNARETFRYGDIALDVPVRVEVPDVPTPTPTPRPASAADRAALEAFYTAAGGPDWSNNTNWLSDAPLGEWYGVAVDERGRVAELELEANGLSGELASEMGNLADLTTLRLSENELTGYHPGYAGQPLGYALSGPLREPVERGDPGSAGRPFGPAVADALRQPAERGDPGGTGGRSPT